MTTYDTPARQLTVFELSGLHEDYPNLVLVEKLKVNDITTTTNGYTLFSIEGTFKTPMLDEDGKPLFKENGYPQDIYVTIKKTFFQGDTSERQAEFAKNYAFYQPYGYLPGAWISFTQCKETTTVSKTGRRYYRVDVTSPLAIHAERPEELEKLFASYREQEALTTPDEGEALTTPDEGEASSEHDMPF
jgi:hypothetical protein